MSTISTIFTIIISLHYNKSFSTNKSHYINTLGTCLVVNMICHIHSYMIIRIKERNEKQIKEKRHEGTTRITGKLGLLVVWENRGGYTPTIPTQSGFLISQKAVFLFLALFLSLSQFSDTNHTAWQPTISYMGF